MWNIAVPIAQVEEKSHTHFWGDNSTGSSQISRSQDQSNLFFTNFNYFIYSFKIF